MLVAPNHGPIKVLHVITQLELGGAQRSTLALLECLDRRRFAPTLLSSDGWLTRSARQIPGLPVELWPGLRRAIHPLADAMTLARLVAFIRRGRYQIVHTHSSKAGVLGRWAARLAKTPVVVHTIHGFGFHPFQRALVQRCYQFLERRTSRITDGLIAVSQRDRETGLRLGIGHPERYRIIRYGIAREAFGRRTGTTSSLRRMIGLDPDRPVVGTVACLKPQKAPLDFLRACRLIRQRVPEAQFVLIGDGVLRPQVERCRTRWGLQDALHLLGWRDDVPALLPALDVFVLASRWEGLPIACLEALAAGVPVVATAAGGTPELIEHGRNGWLVPVAQPERLAQAVVSLLRDPEARRGMSQAASGSLNGEYTVDRMVAETERWYEQLLDASSLGIPRPAEHERQVRQGVGLGATARSPQPSAQSVADSSSNGPTAREA